jgi:drug/metabolite transporter (DMT)-like permease
MKKVTVISLAIFACFLWSTAFVGVKIGLNYMPAPFTFAGMRFFLAGLLLVPFSWDKNSIGNIIRNWKLITYVVFLNTFIGYGIYYVALTYVSGATAAIVIGSGPLITAIMSHFLMHNDKMNRVKMLSISLGIFGIAIIVINSKPLTAVGKLETFGIVLLLLNSALGSFANIKVAQMNKGIGAKFLTSNQMLWGGVMLLILGRVVEGRYSFSQPFEFYSSLCWLAMVSAVAFSIWFRLLQLEEVKVSELNMWKFIIPVSGACLSWAMLPEESPDFLSIFGMLMVFLSLVIHSRYISR